MAKQDPPEFRRVFHLQCIGAITSDFDSLRINTKAILVCHSGRTHTGHGRITLLHPAARLEFVRNDAGPNQDDRRTPVAKLRIARS
jgi:hypothetical protein